MSWPRIALVLASIGFLGFGIAYVLWPMPMGRLTDIPLPTPNARIDFAATYGGVQLGLGTFFLVASRRPGWIEPGLWAAAAVFAGLFLVRIQSMLVINGSPTRVIVAALAIEATGLLVTIHALRRWRRTARTA